LLKKYLTSRTPNIKKNDVSNLIDIVLEDLEKSKFINDKFYSESKAKSLIQRGSSINKIRNYLINKGVGEKYIKNTIEQIRTLLNYLEQTDLLKNKDILRCLDIIAREYGGEVVNKN